VLSGIKEIKAVMADAERLRRMGKRTILFIDEIHRFKQSAAGRVPALRGTRRHHPDRRHHGNPSFEVIAALLSRSRVYALRGLTVPETVMLLTRALPVLQLEASADLLEQIAIYAQRRCEAGV
jgi:putative ATPase